MVNENYICIAGECDYLIEERLLDIGFSFLDEGRIIKQFVVDLAKKGGGSWWGVGAPYIK